MINKINFFSYFLILILPITLISGSAIPDISITLISFFFIIYLIFDKKFELLQQGWIRLSIIFWLYLQISSLFSENIYLAYKDSLIFIRILLIPIFLYCWILVKQKRITYLLGIIFFTNLFIIIDCEFDNKK